MTKLRLALTLAVSSLSFENLGREEGQTLAEYALILALIAVGVIAAVILLQGSISGLFTSVGSKI